MTNFTYLLNNQASGLLRIYSVSAHFCWSADTGDYWFKQNDNTANYVSGGGSLSLPLEIEVSPQIFGSCPVTISTLGRADGDYFNQTWSQQTSVDIVETPPPIFSASSNVSFGKTPLTVQFRAVASESGYGLLRYLWSFGDGGISSLPSPVHTFLRQGVYNVTLVVRDERNLTSTSYAQITAGPNPIDPLQTLGIVLTTTIGAIFLRAKEWKRKSV